MHSKKSKSIPELGEFATLPPNDFKVQEVPKSFVVFVCNFFKVPQAIYGFATSQRSSYWFRTSCAYPQWFRRKYAHPPIVSWNAIKFHNLVTEPSRVSLFEKKFRIIHAELFTSLEAIRRFGFFDTKPTLLLFTAWRFNAYLPESLIVLYITKGFCLFPTKLLIIQSTT